MSRVIVLDSSPLALIVQRQTIPRADECRAWVKRHVALGTPILVPEIVRYELRRELLRLQNGKSIAHLDGFIAAERGRFLALTSKDLDRAALLWAESRRSGLTTADPHALDIDVILASQALGLGIPSTDFVVATSNAKHLSQFVPCEQWDAI
jgi:predicted nucleic acid-binding protein